jgi:hypothetical protein
VLIFVTNEEQMSWNISDLDCSKMLINPASPKLVNFLEEKIPTFRTTEVKYQEKVFTKSMVYRYILLMYDPDSEIQKMQSLDLFGKKYEAAGYAGFKLKKSKDGNLRFDSRVDDLVFGRNEAAIDLICDFLAWVNNAQWEYIVFLKEAMLGFTRDAIGKKITKHKSSQEYMKLYQDYRTASQDLSFIFDETQEFVSRFYYKIEMSRLAIRPEDYSLAIKEGDDFRGDNPYGVNYIVDKIKFIGDNEDIV